MPSLQPLLLSLLFVLMLLNGCQKQQSTFAGPLLPENSLPVFIDDTHQQSLLSCAYVHKKYLTSRSANYRATIAGKSYPRSWLLLSIDEFIAFLEKNPTLENIDTWLKKNYLIIPAEGRQRSQDKKMLVTGYYAPLFAGSYKRQAPYLYPLYSVPGSLISRRNATTGQQSVGRLNNNNRLIPFWTRAEIENSRLLAGHELVYLKDPVDAFLLHVQGSGTILLPDGKQKPIRFAGHNGHKYRSIGKLLVDEGKFTLEEASIPAIRSYLAKHPDELQRILQSNPRFIFFTWSDSHNPKGSLGQPLTPGRSIAIDRKVLPDSTFAWLETTIPVIDKNGKIIQWQSSHRFVFPQDSGAAIQGTGRVDIFWGSGLYAETAANHMKESGKLYFFIKKGFGTGH